MYLVPIDKKWSVEARKNCHRVNIGLLKISIADLKSRVFNLKVKLGYPLTNYEIQEKRLLDSDGEKRWRAFFCNQMRKIKGK